MFLNLLKNLILQLSCSKNKVAYKKQKENKQCYFSYVFKYSHFLTIDFFTKLRYNTLVTQFIYFCPKGNISLVKGVSLFSHILLGV